MYRFRLLQRIKLTTLIGTVALVILIIILTVRALFFSPEKEALQAVQDFYEFEMDGNFAESWEMFHPLMKEKFTKGHYIQDRAHVFLNHFAVETFTVNYGKPEYIKEWQMDNNAPVLHDVYKIPITMTFQGKYGNFVIHQDVYCHLEDYEWTILWSYEK